MKILFLISSMGSGGAERVVSILANHLCNEHKVTIATFSNQPSFYDFDPSITYFKLGLLKASKNVFEQIFNSIWRIKRLAYVIKEEDPDVVVSFMTQTNFLAILAAKWQKKPIVISERIAYDFYGVWINRIKRALYPFCDAFVVQTKGDAQHYAYLSQTKIIPNPLSLSPMKKVQKETVVLAVGRLEKQKGFHLLIEAFSKLKQSGWKLVIAGDGSERENLLRLIDDLKLSNVELIGRRSDIFDWYAKASIFALSSQKEGFPNVLVEAMAFGCGVVSFDCPYGPGEIIEHEVNGLLVPDQDVKALTDALQRLIDDEELRNRLSKEAQKVRQKYSIEKIASEWLKVMEDVTK